MELQITRAIPEDADVLTGIAIRAKKQWGYPDAWIAAWSGALTVTADSFQRNDIYKAMTADRIIGFYAVKHASGVIQLDDLWVDPDFMHRGVGRGLFNHAAQLATAMGFFSLEIEADPNAEGFYLRMGARRIGTNITSVCDVRRELPVLRFDQRI